MGFKFLESPPLFLPSAQQADGFLTSWPWQTRPSSLSNIGVKFIELMIRCNYPALISIVAPWHFSTSMRMRLIAQNHKWIVISCTGGAWMVVNDYLKNCRGMPGASSRWKWNPAIASNIIVNQTDLNSEYWQIEFKEFSAESKIYQSYLHKNNFRDAGSTESLKTEPINYNWFNQ